MALERIVQLHPAYDRRDPDPNRNYGIHGVDLRMIVKGKNGATQFVLYTGWHLPHVQEELKRKDRILSEPLPADVGYHSLTPRYEGHTAMGGTCDILGTTCYYDGSGLQAKEVFKRLLCEGDTGVWDELETRYKELFGDE